MPVIVRSSETVARPAGGGVTVEVLLSPGNTGSDHVLLDRVSFAGGAAYEMALDGGAMGWLQVLAGSGTLAPGSTHRSTPTA